MRRKILFLAAIAFIAAALAAQTLTLVTAKFSYDDGTPVAGSVALFRTATPEVLLGIFPLDAQGRFSTSVALDPSAQYHAELLASDGKTVILEARSVPLPSSASALAAQIIAMLPTGEIDFVISKSSPSVASTQMSFTAFPPPPPPTAPVVLGFSNPAPGQNPISGIYKAANWGAAQWSWEGPWNACPDNNIFFNDSTGIARQFSFLAPSVLAGAEVCSSSSGTVTLASDAGENFSQSISPAKLTALTTGWTKPATRITVTFTNGWDLAFDTISYR